MKTRTFLVSAVLMLTAAMVSHGQDAQDNTTGQLIAESATLSKEIQKVYQQQNNDEAFKKINAERNQRYQIIHCMNSLISDQNQNQDFAKRVEQFKLQTKARIARISGELEQLQRKLKMLNSVQNKDDCIKIRDEEQANVRIIDQRCNELRKPYDLKAAKVRDGIKNYHTKCIEFGDLFKQYAFKPQYVDSLNVYGNFQGCNANFNWMRKGKNYANCSINLYRNHHHGRRHRANTITLNNHSYTLLGSNNRYLCLLAGDLQVSFNLNNDASKSAKELICEFIDLEKLSQIKVPQPGKK